MKKIFILCDLIHLDVGGLARAVLLRSLLFAKKGYDVSILTIEADKNYDYISEELRKRKDLPESVEIINIYNYYRDQNTKKSFIKKGIQKFKYYSKAVRIQEYGYSVIDEYETKKQARYLRSKKYLMFKKWRAGGSLAHIDYFNGNGSLKRRLSYVHGLVTKETLFDAGKTRQKKYYTSDGFCYLIELYNNNVKKNLIFLFSRTNKVITFNNDKEFHKHFITELCKKCDDKPYLICDGSGPSPMISNIEPEVAYRISQLHSNPYEKPYKFGSSIRKIGILEGIGKEDAFVTLTKKQNLDIKREFGDGGNHFVIPNFLIDENKLLEKNPNKISIFIRFSPEKNLEDAVKAFQIVSEKRDHASLEIFGRALLPNEKKELKKIKNLIKKLNLENKIHIKGHSLNVYEEMSESLATILTSKFEGFGMVIIESMLNRTPVISYDINYGPEDIIDHDVNGFLVENGNIEQMAEYIIELLDNPEKAKTMGIAARKKVLENYSSDIVLKKWEDLFEKISNNQN